MAETTKSKEAKGKEVDISWSSDKRQKKIILPEQMELDTAITWLERKKTELEKQIETTTVFECYPTDGAVAFYRALEDVYGFTDPQRRKSWFGSYPPVFKDIKTGVDESVRVPVGEIKVPDVAGAFYSQWTVNDGRAKFQMTFVGKKKHEPDVQRVIEETKEQLAKNSIYRGKAIRMKFPHPDEIRGWEDFEPHFLDTTRTNPEQLIFPDDVDRKVKTSLFTPVQHTDRVRAAGVPLKRGVLLAGPYGVGKTLTASVLAKYCEDNGWAYLYLREVKDLPMAINFAQMYGPAAIFAEDIDEVLGTSARTSQVNQILNTIDGVDSKSAEIMVVLTTNHVEDINRAMLRPGRLDDVIRIPAPDASAAVRLVKQYGGDLLEEGGDFEAVGNTLEGMIPSVIREVVERAKLNATRELILKIEAGDAKENTALVITPLALKDSAETMRDQLELLAEQAPDERSDLEKAADRLNVGFGMLAGLPAFQQALEAKKNGAAKAS